MSYKKLLFLGLLLLGLALALAACQAAPAPAETTPCPDCPAPEPCPEAAPCPDCPTCPEPLVADVPNAEAWASSGHADAAAEAFRHWDGDSPQEVPASCAQCHTPTGFLDYVGADGTAAGTVENNQPVSNGITCVACHSDAAANLTSVMFPSGLEISGLGASTRCAVCHQGRSSSPSLETAITDAGLAETPDAVSADLRFVNIHYFAAAATLFGTDAQGGYQYAGQSYDGRFPHVEGYTECANCHNPHTLQLRIEQCANCHEGVASVEDLQNVRMFGSLVDYDGDGDMTEGIAGEITTLQELLLTAIQAYGTEVAGSPIAYDAGSYPYFFIDTNANGTADDDEKNNDNRYASWTARLLRAAYNYQTSIKDPGAFAHNAKYIIELLYDSISDLNTSISAPIDLSAAHRQDAGHFDATAEAFRHWDEEGDVPAGCAKCHSATGLPQFLHEASLARDGVTGIVVGQPAANGFACATCHDVQNWPARYAINGVKFPSGATVTFGDASDGNLCINCHQGRESTVSVNRAIGDTADDTVAENLTFRNPHYFAAGATLFGTEAQGAYEYTGQTYLGHHAHIDIGFTCLSCHDAHALTINVEACAGCHVGVEDITAIRMTQGDFDGDGDSTEGIAGEIATMEDALLVAIQNYATTTAGAPIGYNGHIYPYFFGDANANGERDADEGAYTTWTPRLLRAAYNYQWVQKDPGAFAHNAKYIMQVLYDSLNDLGAATGMTRP